MRPKVDIVVGGQYGSEAKGKVCAHLAGRYAAAVRGGAENAGHTIVHKGRAYKNQVVPVAWVNRACRLYIGAGAAFSLGQLQVELGWEPTISSRLRVDPGAVIIEQKHRQQELDAAMGAGIGSTQHGCGAALADKIWRVNGVKLAGMVPELGPWVDGASVQGRVSSYIARHVARDDSVMLEGTQGTLLSLDHAPYYPFCTSRNVTAGAVAAESGVPSALVRDVILVVRTLPIRVGGNSGPTGGRELTWEEVSKRAGRRVEEFTTVTQKRRRIFEFDWLEMDYSVQLNRPTQTVVTFADYMGAENYGVTDADELNKECRDFCGRLEVRYGARVTLVSTGPEPEHMVERPQSRFWRW